MYTYVYYQKFNQNQITKAIKIKKRIKSKCNQCKIKKSVFQIIISLFQ